MPPAISDPNGSSQHSLASAPIEALYTHFGITPQAVVEAVKAQL